MNSYIQKVIQEGKASHISYFARVLNNWWTFWFDTERRYIPASLIKLPLSIAVLKNTPFERLSDTVTLWDDVEILDRNIWTEHTQLWGTYTLRELLENILIYSDNLATEALIELLWEDIINTVYKDLNLGMLDYDYPDSTYISPKLYSSFFRILYNASYIWHNRSEYLLRVLSKSDYKDGIAWPIPDFIRISNKFWERSFTDHHEKQLHDCGIIYAQQWPYTLCIMTSWDNFDYLTDIIQTISKMIYTSLL